MPRTTTASNKGKDESVRVVVRCRPMSDQEQESGCERVVDIDGQRRQISIRRSTVEFSQRNTDDTVHAFFFDSVYDWNSQQKDVYDQTARPLVDSVLEGFNGTIFAYGQTGTGKTFTMEGVRSQVELRGIIPSSFAHIFDSISHTTSRQFLVRASYLEIYNESIRDLLSRDQNKRLQLQEHPKEGVHVHDLSSFITKNIQEIEHVMTTGNLNRSTGATNMNEHSSRSHAIFIITVESSEIGVDGKAHIRVGKLNLVDLAGSERQAKTGSTGERFKEATNINLSLSVLGNVISALVDGSSHIPYRDSKLTRLLQNSLGGNSKTIMIATLGPADYNYEESLTTLRYANRAKNIKNQPRINEDPKDALLRKFQEEIARLKEQLDGRTKSGKTSRRHRNHDEADNDESNYSDQNDEELYLKEQQDKLNEEKRSIFQKKNLNETEREIMLRELEEKQQEIQREQDERREMQNKIQQMESKLITGGKDIVTHTSEQEETLRQKRRLIAEAERRHREVQQKLEQGEEERQTMNEKYTNVKEEVEDKRAKKEKLSKQLKKLEAKKLEIVEKHRTAREELEAEQREIQKQAKLFQLIIKNFIPIDECDRLLKRVQFDDQHNQWTLKELSKQTDQMAARPILARGDRRPIALHSQSNSIPEIAYFKGENIILLQLDFPSRTTRDYEGPMVSPMIKATIENAMREEEYIELDANNIPPEKRKKKNSGGTYDNNTSSTSTMSRIGYGDLHTSRSINSARR
ncbi:unnamed protein product [Rotaria sp. Silwood1]|nr:unnamed protein product [Rotaria sp. Silwood1]CAF3375364.1 unnamed protein product [Rotaria sp. Silwood1]CAF3394150.1 unnamed protein product [Rotaria sp. Silwood1]CAF3395227.1 unnamed protein product [Rotaria sp. Silwood1]CAF4559792.1 unnamed protein product [Rotaria sp. Silwood1]